MSILAESSSSPDLTYRPDIDGLRGIAIVAVLVFHIFPTWLPGGFVGVDVFFVVSGYLITSIINVELETNSFTFLQFYSRRIRRLFPSLIAVLLACYIAGWYSLYPSDFGNLSAYIFAGSCFFANFLANRDTEYFSGPIDTKPLLHLWSLGVEEQFYIVWPVILYAARKARFNVPIVTAALALTSFAVNVSRVTLDRSQTFYWPTSRFWELLMGAQLSFLSKYPKGYCASRNGNIVCDALSIVGTLLIALPMCWLGKRSVFPGWWALSPTTGTAFLITTGPAGWINRTVLCTNVLLGIGLVSYPLYLYHWSLLIFMKMGVEHSLAIHERSLIILISITAAWMTYWFVERPMRMRSLSPTKHRCLVVIMSMIALIALLTHRYDGLPSRFSPYIRNVTSLTENYYHQHESAYGPYDCFLEPRRGRAKFGACTINIDKPASTAIMLWGDSYAAHLRPGLVAQQIDFRLTQLTASECPPIYGFDRGDIPLCKQINDEVLRRILSEKPNVVLLAAHWGSYPWGDVENTIVYLRDANIKNIYLLGPLPFWNKGLPRVLCDYYAHVSPHSVPSRLTHGLNAYQQILDDEMNTFVANLGINYISQYKILCNSDGCLTRVDESISTITVYDQYHLTIAGSTFVASHFPKTLLHAE